MARDKLLLEGMVFYGYHGVEEDEKRLGQRFVVDVELTSDLSRAGRSDLLQDTINYAAVYRLVRGVMEGPSHNLIESLAEEIATRILADARVEEVRVRVKKPSVPIKGSILSAAAVEIVRGQTE